MSKPTGLSTEADFLYRILRAIERLQQVTANVRGPQSAQDGLEADYYNPTFFKAGRTYLNLNVTNNGTVTPVFSAGITPTGTELLSDQIVSPGDTVSFPINVSYAVDTPLYFWSYDWTDAILDIKAISL